MDIVREIIDRESGDFSSAARLTADSFVTIKQIRHHDRSTVVRSRAYEVPEVRSLVAADLVAADVFSSDFYPEED